MSSLSIGKKIEARKSRSKGLGESGMSLEVASYDLPSLCRTSAQSGYPVNGAPACSLDTVTLLSPQESMRIDSLASKDSKFGG